MDSSLSLPLKFKTPDIWASQVLADPLALLSDHLYLEKKAASNALQLLNRWPDSDQQPLEWAMMLSTVAKDETQHLHMVARLLKKRGGKLQRFHRNPYTAGLHQFIRKGLWTKEVVDQLLITAIIEARSCERFEVLGRNCKDEELAKFYTGLCSSEMGHYTLFYQLAEKIMPKPDVQARWEILLQNEAELMQVQPVGPRIHSGHQ